MCSWLGWRRLQLPDRATSCRNNYDFDYDYNHNVDVDVDHNSVNHNINSVDNFVAVLHNSASSQCLVHVYCTK